MNDAENGSEIKAELSEDERLFTADEVAAMIEREIGRLSADAEQKRESELNARIEEECRRVREEAEEMKNAEIAALRDQLEAAREERMMRERELECANLLGEMRLPLSLAPLALDSDAEAMHAKIAALGEAFGEAVSREVDERLGSMRPSAAPAAPLSREALRKLPLAELQRLYGSAKNT